MAYFRPQLVSPWLRCTILALAALALFHLSANGVVDAKVQRPKKHTYEPYTYQGCFSLMVANSSVGLFEAPVEHQEKGGGTMIKKDCLKAARNRRRDLGGRLHVFAMQPGSVCISGVRMNGSFQDYLLGNIIESKCKGADRQRIYGITPPLTALPCWDFPGLPNPLYNYTTTTCMQQHQRTNAASGMNNVSHISGCTSGDFVTEVVFYYFDSGDDTVIQGLGFTYNSGDSFVVGSKSGSDSPGGVGHQPSISLMGKVGATTPVDYITAFQVQTRDNNNPSSSQLSGVEVILNSGSSLTWKGDHYNSNKWIPSAVGSGLLCGVEGTWIHNDDVDMIFAIGGVFYDTIVSGELGNVVYPTSGTQPFAGSITTDTDTDCPPPDERAVQLSGSMTTGYDASWSTSTTITNTIAYASQEGCSFKIPVPIGSFSPSGQATKTTSEATGTTHTNSFSMSTTTDETAKTDFYCDVEGQTCTFSLIQAILNNTDLEWTGTMTWIMSNGGSLMFPTSGTLTSSTFTTNCYFYNPKYSTDSSGVIDDKVSVDNICDCQIDCLNDEECIQYRFCELGELIKNCDDEGTEHRRLLLGGTSLLAPHVFLVGLASPGQGDQLREAVGALDGASVINYIPQDHFIVYAQLDQILELQDQLGVTAALLPPTHKIAFDVDTILSAAHELGLSLARTITRHTSNLGGLVTGAAATTRATPTATAFTSGTTVGLGPIPKRLGYFTTGAWDQVAARVATGAWDQVAARVAAGASLEDVLAEEGQGEEGGQEGGALPSPEQAVEKLQRIVKTSGQLQDGSLSVSLLIMLATEGNIHSLAVQKLVTQWKRALAKLVGVMSKAKNKACSVEATAPGVVHIKACPEVSDGSVEATAPGIVLIKACAEHLAAVTTWVSQQPQVVWVEPRLETFQTNIYSSTLIQTGEMPNPKDVDRDGLKLPEYHPFWVVGLNGSGQVVSVVDTGAAMGSCYLNDASIDVLAVTKETSKGSNHWASRFTAVQHRKVANYFAYRSMYDEVGHGTHVAGTILGYPEGISKGQSVENWIDAAGIAPGARLAVFDAFSKDMAQGALDVPSDLGTYL
eukprot:gene10174-8079_t